MGGQSTGTWKVENGIGVMNGVVADVPSLKAPGFIKAAADGSFPNASAAAGGSLELLVRSKTPEYKGFRVTVAYRKGARTRPFSIRVSMETV